MFVAVPETVGGFYWQWRHADAEKTPQTVGWWTWIQTQTAQDDDAREGLAGNGGSQ